jgi:hypothetical protein
MSKTLSRLVFALCIVGAPLVMVGCSEGEKPAAPTTTTTEGAAPATPPTEAAPGPAPAPSAPAEPAPAK